MKNIYANAICAMLLTCLLMPQAAYAHRLNVFAWLESDNILVECNFGEKRPAQNADVMILDDTDHKELLTGKTNAEGKFSFPVPDVIRQGHGLIIIVNAGQGHRGEWAMSASELYAAASLSAGFDAAAIKAARNEQHTHLNPRPLATTSTNTVDPELTQAQLGAMLHSALEQYVGPIQRQLAAQAAKGPGLTEIIGGIGWIIGLVGIGLYFKSRKS